MGTPSTGPVALPRWRVFPVVGIGVIMATLDASIVNIALPTLQKVFVAPLSLVTWVALGYLVTITGLLLTAGRLADLRGRRRVYGVGIALFSAASLLCGLASSVQWLIAARVLQGLGAALVSANGSALLVSAFPLEERGKALGAFGAMVGVGLAAGSPLGGFLIQHASWRWIFFMNVPLGAITLLLLRRNVPADHPNPDAAPLEPLAVLTWCGALVALMLALSRGTELGWSSPSIVMLFVAAAVLLVLFAAGESRSRQPLLPLPLLLGPLGAAVLLTLLGQAMVVAIGFQLPFHLSSMFGYSPNQVGLWNSVLPVAALVFAPLAGGLADRLGARPLTTLGMAMTAGGFLLLSRLGMAAAPWQLPAGLALIGAGQGLFAVPNASALLSLVPAERLGLASGLQNTTRYLGLTSGVALMGAMMSTGYAARAGRPLGMAGPAMVRTAYAGAMQGACLTLAAIAVVATLLAGVQHREPQGRI